MEQLVLIISLLFADGGGIVLSSKIDNCEKPTIVKEFKEIIKIIEEADEDYGEALVSLQCGKDVYKPFILRDNRKDGEPT